MARKQEGYKLTEWITIESAPKDRRILLYFSDCRVQYCGKWNEVHGEFITNSYAHLDNPTHWMELPGDPE